MSLRKWRYEYTMNICVPQEGIWIGCLNQSCPKLSRIDGAGFPSLAADTARWRSRYRKIRAGTESRLAPESGGQRRRAVFARNRGRGKQDARRPPLSRCNWRASFAHPPWRRVDHQFEFRETFPVRGFSAQRGRAW